MKALSGMTVGNLLSTAAVRYRDREAFVCAETKRRFTFGETNDRANRLANGLAGLGLGRGDAVAFLCGNRSEIAEIYFALAKSGVVGIPLNYRLAAPEIVELMRATGARALLCDARRATVVPAVREALPDLRAIVAIGEAGEEWGQSYERLLVAASAAEPAVDVREGDPYYFNLTSGTTGLPKAYVLTHYNNSTLWPLMATMDLSSRDVVMTVFPAFGRSGFAWIATSVLHGIKNVLVNFEPRLVLELLAQERVTIVNVVPTMASMMLAERDAVRGVDLGALRAVVFGGAPLPATLREQVQGMLCRDIYEYYGMQESGALVVSTPADRRSRPASVGRVVPFADVRIVDEHGVELPRGDTGEIVGRAPTATIEYLDDPVRSAETFRRGWLHTGDLGEMDEDGFLFIRGRKKDVIVSGGQNVHAAEVEEAILSCPGVIECAVIGLPDKLWGERVSAIVVCAAETTVGEDEVQNACRDRLAGFKVPKQVIVSEAPLPRTPSGKVQKHRLVQHYSAPDATW